MTEESPCPLCGETHTHAVAAGVRDFEYGAPGEYRWLGCDGCGLIRLSPFPSAQVLSRAYPPDYHAYVRPSSGLTRWLYQVVRQGFAKKNAATLEPGASIFDLGCSTGDQLSAFRDLGPYKLFGVEYRARAADEARSKGIRVWTGELEDADVPADSMDLAVMQHVLEHVVDPVDTMHRVLSVLKPGGRVHGELPNVDSLDARLFGRYWGGGHAPRHLWHFTPVTLERTLRQCEFERIEVRPALHTGHWALSIQNWLRRKSAASEGLAGGRTWYYPPLLLATVPINLLQMPFLKTGVMRFEAYKPGR